MGLFDLFKKATVSTSDVENKPTLKDGSVKTYDYFAFKVHGVDTVEGSQEVLKSIGCKLHEKPIFAMLKLEDGVLNVYINKKRIGSGDAQATKKFVEHCQKKWEIYSCSIYGGTDGKSYGCKIRVKFYY